MRVFAVAVMIYLDYKVCSLIAIYFYPDLAYLDCLAVSCTLLFYSFVYLFVSKAVQQRDKWTIKSKKAALWEKAHERNAKRVLNLMIELEGLWVKLGQYLSTRADVLPPAYISLLKQLQDSLPPRPVQEVVF